MKRLKATTLAALAVAVLVGGAALAGDWHQDGASGLVCSDCHVMHFSQTHGYLAPNFDDDQFLPDLGAGGPFHYLLRNEINDLCLDCHDGAPFAPDVLETQTGTAVRNAGALNRGNAPYYEQTGHTLESMAPPPGTDGSYVVPDGGLNCVSCHHPHGYGGGVTTYGPDGPYRNLSGSMVAGGNAGVTYCVNAPCNPADNLYDVYERTATVYTVDNIDYMEPDQTQSGLGVWCSTCHSDFHGTNTDPNIAGTGGGTEEFVRHPTAGVNIGALTGGHSNLGLYIDGAAFGPGTKTAYVKVMTGLGEWPTNGTTWVPTGTANDLTPSCMSCHKAHGNQNAFGLIYMGNTAPVTEEGTAGGSYNDMCKQCHVQGG